MMREALCTLNGVLQNAEKLRVKVIQSVEFVCEKRWALLTLELKNHHACFELPRHPFINFVDTSYEPAHIYMCVMVFVLAVYSIRLRNEHIDCSKDADPLAGQRRL